MATVYSVKIGYADPTDNVLINYTYFFNKHPTRRNVVRLIEAKQEEAKDSALLQSELQYIRLVVLAVATWPAYLSLGMRTVTVYHTEKKVTCDAYIDFSSYPLYNVDEGF